MKKASRKAQCFGLVPCVLMVAILWWNKGVEGFQYPLKTGNYAQYSVKIIQNGKSQESHLRTALVSEEKRNGKIYYWIEHDIFPQGGGDIQKMKALIPADNWRAYLTNPVKNPLKPVEVHLEIREKQVKKLKKPEEFRDVASNFGPGFIVLKDFAQAVKEKPKEKVKVKVKSGEYLTQRYEVVIQTTEEYEMDGTGTRRVSTRNQGDLWATSEIPFGIVKIALNREETISYQVGEGVRILTPPEIKKYSLEMELLTYGNDATSLFSKE